LGNNQIQGGINMSMFYADAAFALELIALALGVFLLVWLRIHTEQAHKMCKFFAYLIIVLAILALLCTSYYSMKYWVAGYFGHPRAMMMQGKMKSGQMQQMMKRCKMMQNKMKDQMQGPMKDGQHMMQPKDMQKQMPMHKKDQKMPMQ
jgi:predicted membrane protein